MGYLCVQQEEVDEKSESRMIEVFDVDVGNDWDWGAREGEWTSLSSHPQNSFSFPEKSFSADLALSWSPFHWWFCGWNHPPLTLKPQLYIPDSGGCLSVSPSVWWCFSTWSWQIVCPTYLVASEGMLYHPVLFPENRGVMVRFRHSVKMRHYAKSWRSEGIKAEGLVSQRVDIFKNPGKWVWWWIANKWVSRQVGRQRDRKTNRKFLKAGIRLARN